MGLPGPCHWRFAGAGRPACRGRLEVWRGSTAIAAAQEVDGPGTFSSRVARDGEPREEIRSLAGEHSNRRGARS